MKNTITVLSIVRRQDEDRIKSIFVKVLGEYYNSDISELLKIGTPKQIPNQLLFAVELDVTNAVEIIKKLTSEGVGIIKNDPSVGAAVNEAKYEMELQQANAVQRIKKESSLKRKLEKKGTYSLEELEYLRDWKLMVDFALKQPFKDIDKSRRIKEMLPEVLTEAINKEIEAGARSLGSAKNSIEKLTAIVENETLRRLHFTASIKRAGDAIIEFCKQYPKDLLGDLVFLANSPSTVSTINVKAFLTFYKIVIEDQQTFEYEILVATRHLNTRALDTIHLSSVRLAPEEAKLFESGIEFFKEKRKSI